MKFTEGQIEHGIFEAIRKKIVSMGYYPDIVPLLALPDDQFKVALEAAKNAIIAQGKELIEVFGLGDIQDRDELHNNSIIIRRDDFAPGNLGFYLTESFEERTDGDFNNYSNPSGTVTLQYQISYITNSAKYDRLIHSAIINSLGAKTKYLPGVNDDGSEMDRLYRVKYVMTLDKSSSDFIERALRYNVVDVLIEEPIFKGIVKGIKEITIGTSTVEPGNNQEFKIPM